MSHDANLNVETWRDAWRDLGCAGSDSDFHELAARYAEDHRRYHTTQHLSECLGLWRTVRALASRPGEVAVALWFHDAVYDTKRQDNEERSANLARDAVTRAGLASEVGDRVHALIMATRHDAVPTDGDMQLLVDIDLSILGADAARFDEYEHQVREEYAWVPSIMFRRTRRTILEQFLERPRIFQTEHFHQAREVAARQNLQRSVMQLGG